MISITNASMADAETLNELYFTLMGVSAEIQKLKTVLEHILDNEFYHLLVARDESGKAAATAMGILCYDLTTLCEPFMVIENVVVSESMRRMGVGRMLFSALESIARENDCVYMMLVSDSERKESHSFYERVGFKREMGFKKMLRNCQILT